MNKKTAIVLLLLILVNLTGVQTSFAKPEYVADLITVYGKGSCDTCHVNGTSDGPRTAYGTLFENQPGHAANASAAMRAIGAPPGTTPTPMATMLTPMATMTPEETATPAVTAITTTGTAKTPGFGIVVSLVGLFTLFLLVRKRNK